MRPLLLACALVLAMGPGFGCGAKSGLSYLTLDPLDPAAQTPEDSGATSNPNDPDAASPKQPPRMPMSPAKPTHPHPWPNPTDAGTFDTGHSPPRGTGGAPPTTGRPDAAVPPPEASVPPTGPIAIGILKNGEVVNDTCLARFVNSLGGDARVEAIDSAADYAMFRSYNLIVACSNWAEHERTEVLGRPDLYTRYVTEGGGLLMFQPNPYPLEILRIDLLPEWFIVANFYTDETTSLVNPNHPVTRGLTSDDMPYPADRITAFSDAWTVLSRGDQSGNASLIVVDIGRGRAAVDSAHHELGVGKGSNNNSDALIRQLSLWLTHRL